MNQLVPGQQTSLADSRGAAVHDLEGENINNYGGASEHESDLLRLFRIFMRRKWIILAITVTCAALAMVYSFIVQPSYTASVRVEIARESTNVLNMDDVDADAAAVGAQEFYQTQYELMKSRSLAEAVVRDLSLIDNKEFLAQSGGDGDDLIELNRLQRLRLATDLVQDNSRVSPVPASGIVDISYDNPQPLLARNIANSIAENFIEITLSRRYEASSYAREFLQDRLVTVRQRLESSERQAAAYAARQGLVKIEDNIASSGALSPANTLTAAQLSQLSEQLAEARALREIAEANFRTDSGGTANVTALVNETVSLLRRERGSLIGQLSKLESDFGNEYPQVVALREQISALDRTIEAEENRVSDSIDSSLQDDYRKALAAERRLEARVNQLRTNVLDEQQRAIAYNIIQRDVDTNRALYEALLQRFKEVGIAGGVGTNNVSIVDPAIVPTDPSSPNIPLNLLIGLVIGLFASAGTVFVLEQIADAVILPDDFERKLSIPLLGTTPKLLEIDEDDENRQGNQLALTESYFSILTAIQFSTASGTPRALLVTSSQEGEGKSTTAFSIAKDLGAVGHRVLLIDADMRRPTLHKTLNRQMSGGLSDLLVGRENAKAKPFASGFAMLDGLMAGPTPPNPAELLSGRRMRELLAEFREDYDHIVIDGPPILGIADAPLLSNVVDGTVFVVEYGRTAAAQARMAIQRLRAVRANIVGAVLTKLDAKAAGYGDNYGYRYHYGTDK